MINFKCENQMTALMVNILNLETNVTLVIEKDNLEDIIDGMCIEYKTLTKEINDERFTYVVDKREDSNGDIHIHIYPVDFDEDGDLQTIIENDYVVVVDCLLSDEDIEQIYAGELLLRFDYELCSQDCEFCTSCENEPKTEDDVYEEFADMLEEYALVIQETGGDTEAISKILCEFAIDFSENFNLEEIE